MDNEIKREVLYRISRDDNFFPQLNCVSLLAKPRHLWYDIF